MSSSTSGVVAALLALTVLGCASTRTDIANDSASESPDADLAKLIPDVEVPSDVRIRVTDEGPVFTDAQGMTQGGSLSSSPVLGVHSVFVLQTHVSILKTR